MFTHVNRSQVAHIGHIEGIAEDMVLLQEKIKLKIGNCYRKDLFDHLGR